MKKKSMKTAAPKLFLLIASWFGFKNVGQDRDREYGFKLLSKEEVEAGRSSAYPYTFK